MPYRSDAEIIAVLSDRIENLSRQVFGENYALGKEEPERVNRRYSYMFRYKVEREDGVSRYLLVKIPHHPWMVSIHEAIESEHLRNDVKFEFNILQSISQAITHSGNDQLCAVNPVGCLAELNAVVVEELRLVMLKEFLASSRIMLGERTAWGKFSTELRLAGKWLQFIHGYFSKGKEAAISQLDIHDRMLRGFSFLEINRAAPVDLFRAKFMELYAFVSETKIPLSSVHDDYHLGNIFVTNEGRVGALDPNWKDDRPVFGDLAKLLIDPVTRKTQVIFQGISFRPSLRKKYEDEILLGYFEGKPFPEAALWLYCAVETLEKWALSEEALGENRLFRLSFLRSVALLPIRRYFNQLVQGYLDKGLRRSA